MKWKYKKIKLKSIVMNLNYSNNKNKNLLWEFLLKYEKVINRILGKYTGSDYTIDVKENAKPYHAKPFPIPKDWRFNY